MEAVVVVFAALGLLFLLTIRTMTAVQRQQKMIDELAHKSHLLESLYRGNISQIRRIDGTKKLKTTFPEMQAGKKIATG